MQKAGIVEELCLLDECRLRLAGDHLCSDGLLGALVIVLSSFLLFLLELTFILCLLFKLDTITFLRVLELHRLLLPKLPFVLVDFSVVAAGEQLPRNSNCEEDAEALDDIEFLFLLDAPNNHFLK